MTKEMIISSTSHETRVAILEEDQVVEVFIEREQSRGVVGNVYKGRVSKVLPGMQSAFVDLGLERDAFLYVTDVISPTEESLEDEDEDEADDPSAAIPAAIVAAAAVAAPEDADPAGSSVIALAPEPLPNELPEGNGNGNGNDHPPSGDQNGGHGNGQAQAAAQGQESDRGGRTERRARERTAPAARIEDLLKEGQEVVVQVVKEPLGTKGARITSHLSLPGRFLVYMPTVDHIGISRKIENRDERRRLRGIVQKFREQSGLPGGVIIRTAAASRPEEDIVADLTYFQQVWTEIQRKRETDRTPAVLFREESLVT